MNRITMRALYLVLALGAVGLLALLLMLAAGPQPAAQAAGNTVKVPDDHATIQSAIDAAGDADTILVAGSPYAYEENLSISEGITLSGGWNIAFTERILGDSTIDGQGLGRVISITCPSSDTVVIVDGFTIVNGAAAGLGGPPAAVPEVPHSTLQGSMPQGSRQLTDAPSPAEGATLLRLHLGDLAARGLYPGGPAAYQTMLVKLDRLTVQAEQAQPLSRPTENLTSQSADYGGGIYSWNASLHLLNSTVEDNVASVNNDGYGGGIFVGQAAPSGVIIADNVVQYNTSSMYSDGGGGGLYLFQTPGAVVEHNQFLENAASNGGLLGVGGGLYVDDSAGVLVQRNRVERNTARASWDCPGMGGGGVGGGAQFRMTDDAIVTDNVFRDNLAALHCGSHGGGLYVYKAENVQLEGNEVIDNLGVLFQVYSDDFGGGLGLDTAYNATVTGNVVRGNTTSLVTPHEGMHVSYGGGIFGYALSDSQITSNNISANVASGEWGGFGGGMHLIATEGVVVAENLFADNAASLASSGDGWGGGLDLRNTVGALVRRNHFLGNRGSAGGWGQAGALNIGSWGPHSFDTTVDANLFLDNQASGNPAAHSTGGACIVFTRGFTFTNNVVAGNTAKEAGGLVLSLFEERGVVTNNTLAGNSDAAVVVEAWTTPVTFSNNIVVSHTVGISVTKGTTAMVRYTLWDGNGVDIAGAGTISETHPVTGTPAFAYPANHDYHLAVGSAAINAGDPAGVPPAPPVDLDGVARPVGVAVDLGAYEWQGYLGYLPFVAKD